VAQRLDATIDRLTDTLDTVGDEAD